MGCGAALSPQCPSCQHINPPGAKFCLQCGQKLTAPKQVASKTPPGSPEGAFPSQGSAERRQLTIMFCDLVGSTALSARLDPEDMREIIGEYHRCCSQQIIKAGGFVAKYMGDGVLAYFGYPEAHEDDAERAVRAALAMVDAIQNLRTAHGPVPQVRIGIATGLVVVGDLIGEGDAQERGVVGETPNLAARLQADAEPGQVLISDSTRRLTGGMFEYRDLGRVALKGLTDQIRVWQVTRAAPVYTRSEVQHQTSLTPLIGREEELDLLLRRWHQTLKGQGRVVLLSGEPGIGKSRLAAALEERLRETPHTRLQYFCSPHHQESALFPIITQLERAASLEKQDTANAKVEKLAALFGRSDHQDGDIHLIAELLSIPTEDTFPTLNWTAQQKRERTFHVLLRQLELLADQGPLLILFEDIHWIDPTSRELLDRLIDSIERIPALLLITYRPEFQAPWIGQPHVSTINLGRLGRREGSALVELVAGPTSVSSETMEEIVARTDGIPLFVEELTKAVIESAACEEGAIVSIAPLSAVPVPATLNASLMARLDRLGHAAKEIAQIGSVIGREFPYELLAQVAQRSQRELQARLALLTGAQLLFSRGVGPRAVFLFKHALVRDAAYSSLLRTQRRTIHQRIAEAIERSEPEIAKAQPERLAHHFQEAGQHLPAFRYWQDAGNLAAGRSASREASSHYRAAIDLLPKLSEGRRQELELNLSMKLANSLMQSEGYTSQDSQQSYVRARTIAAQLGKVNEYVRACAEMAPTLFAEARYSDAFDMLNDVTDETIADADPVTRVYFGVMTGVAQYYRGEVDDAWRRIEAAKRVDDLCPCTHDHPVGGADPAVVLRSYGYVIRRVQGYFEQADSLAREAVSIADERQHAFTIAWAMQVRLWFEVNRGELDNAERTGTQLLAFCDLHAYEARKSVGLIYRGFGRIAAGRYREGIDDVKQGFALWTTTGGKFNMSLWNALAAHFLIETGRYSEADEFVASAEAAQRDTEERAYDAEVLRLRGKLLAASGNASAAIANFRDSIALAQRRGTRLFALRSAIDWVRAARTIEEKRDAGRELRSIYGWFTEGFDTTDLIAGRTLLDEVGPS
jgi:class 3 adenylate cyclase/tetratricopeptide (TPR) repeat protein